MILSFRVGFPCLWVCFSCFGGFWWFGLEFVCSDCTLVHLVFWVCVFGGFVLILGFWVDASVWVDVRWVWVGLGSGRCFWSRVNCFCLCDFPVLVSSG